MSTQVDFARIVLLNRTKRELQAANPVLLSGEAAIADPGSIRPDLRFGDGIRPWSGLPSFIAAGLGGGIFAPFEVQNTINGHALFRVNDLPGLAPGDSIITMGPGEAGIAGTNLLQLNGNVNGYVLNVNGATHTVPNIFLASFAAPVNTGRSNGVWISAGTNANDSCFILENAAASYDPPNKKIFFQVRGDGTGFLGPDENNCLYWDSTGWFRARGTARFPGDAISEMRDVQIFNLSLGDVLEWNGTYWANVPPQRGTVTEIRTGTGLLGGPIFESGTIWLADTSVQAGSYTSANITVDQQGRITAAANGGLNDLHDLQITDPSDKQILEFDAATGKWTNQPPPELSTLPDVALGHLVEGQLLAWNGEHWTNADPTHNLGELTNVFLTDPRPGEHLIFDGENWVNATGASVTVDFMAPIDPETGYLWWDTVTGQLFIWYNDAEEHGRWVIANNWQGGGGGASVTVDTTPPADPELGWLWWDSVGGQLYVWYDDGESAQWVIANSGDGGSGGGETPGGGGGLELDFTPWDGCTIRYRGDTNKWTWTNIQADEWGTWIGASSDTTALQVRGGDNSLTNMWTAQFQSGNGTSRNGVWIIGGNTNSGLAASDMLLRVMNRIGPYNDVLMLYGDGGGWIGPNVSNRLYWDSGGNTTLTGNMAKMIGLSVPIAYAFNDSKSSLNVAITMNLTIPAGLTGTKASCRTPTDASTVVFNVTRYRFNPAPAPYGSWDATAFGTITFYVGYLQQYTMSGSGGTLQPGDILNVSSGIATAMTGIGVTIHATRA